MSNFDLAIPVILKREGGFVDDPNDAGGATNFGLSSRWLRTVYPTFNYMDVKNMTRQVAINTYKTFWWEKYGYSLLVDQGIATKTFDMAVNMGPGVSHRILQHAVNTLGGLSLTLDGFMGPATCNAANACHRAELLASLRVLALSHYHAIVDTRPQDAKFLTGWANRATDRDGLID